MENKQTRIPTGLMPIDIESDTNSSSTVASIYDTFSKKDGFDLAVSLLKDARQSRLEIKYQYDRESVILYNYYYHMGFLFLYYLAMIINLLTIILEEPAAILYNGKPIPYQYPLMINVICETVFYFRWFHILRVADISVMKTSKSFIATIIMLVLMSLDDITLIIQNSLKVSHPIRWSRFLRPVLLLTFPENRRIRTAFENIKCTAIDVSSVFAMFIASLVFISIITLKLIPTDKMTYPDGSKYFPNFIEITWEFYVLSTTANSPDVILPAYEKSVAYFSIYMWICTVCNWLFMGILTASVYNSYKSHLGAHVIRTVVKRKQLLDLAFTILQKKNENRDRFIDRETFMKLMKIVEPNRPENSIKLIFDILDGDHSNTINQAEFARLTEYLQLNFKEVIIDKSKFVKFLPKFYKLYITKRFQTFVKCIQSKSVRWFFDLMVVGNGITLVVAHGTKLELVFEWFFTVLFTVEIILKYLGCGGVRFFTKPWNLFDIFVVGGAFAGQLLQELLMYMKIQTPSSITQCFLLLRLFRLLKLVGQVQIFKCIINCILIILPSLLGYAAILLILYYIFTCAALELFGGLIKEPPKANYLIPNPCNNSKLAFTDYQKMHYCGFNFNNAAQSFAMLFILSVGNNWHVMANGFAAVTNKSYRIFFLCVHWLCVLLVLNIVLAFIIEAFLIEYDPHSSKFEDFILQRMRELNIEAGEQLAARHLQDYTNSQFHLTKKRLAKAFPKNEKQTFPYSVFFFIPEGASLELLMFRMFENEIEALADRYVDRPSMRARVVSF